MGHLQPRAYLIEIGPHCALERPTKETLANEASWIYDYTLRRGVSSLKTNKEMAGRLLVNGFPIDIKAVNRHDQRNPRMLLCLPPYPFNYSHSYWLESRLSKNLRLRETTRHELLGNPSMDWNPLKPKWRLVIQTAHIPWLLDHKVIHTLPRGKINRDSRNRVNTTDRSKECAFIPLPGC